jgi:GNAT superfamily N-acetyltransferase
MTPVIELRFTDEIVTDGPRSSERLLRAFNTEGREVGRIHYTVDASEVRIDIILVYRDMRRRGIGTQLYRKFEEVIPAGLRINWGYVTEDGQAFKRAVNGANGADTDQGC